jgi:hypothetical protein
MDTRTPPEITKYITRLIAKVGPGQLPVYLTVEPDEDAKVNECFPNVQAKIARSGGTMLCGWQLWEWPSVLVEAEFHAIWVSPDGVLNEITPKQDGERTILFVPIPSLTYKGMAKDNVRIPIRDDLLVHHFIRVSEEIFKVMNQGERAGKYGYVHIPAREIEPLLNAKAFLGQSILTGLRDHDPCLCGSGRKYKRCHGRNVLS